MLIPRTLFCGPAHSRQTGTHIERTIDDFLQMQYGLDHSKWEMARGRSREFKCYRLTGKGRKQQMVEESRRKGMAEAVARVRWPAAEES